MSLQLHVFVWDSYLSQYGEEIACCELDSLNDIRKALALCDGSGENHPRVHTVQSEVLVLDFKAPVRFEALPDVQPLEGHGMVYAYHFSVVPNGDGSNFDTLRRKVIALIT